MCEDSGNICRVWKSLFRTHVGVGVSVPCVLDYFCSGLKNKEFTPPQFPAAPASVFGVEFDSRYRVGVIKWLWFQLQSAKT